MIRRSTVFWLGVSQLVSWGITYYLIGGFAETIGADLHWSRDIVYGGFSGALLVMALVSPIAGRMIDRHGGGPVMVTGSVLNALGCIGLATCHGLVQYFVTWACLGVSMRLTLYDAAFAALARIGGPEARRPISQITLLGGLASTVFWPLGNLLAEHFGWRGALLCYAGFALATIPMHLAIPSGSYADRQPEEKKTHPAPRAASQGDIFLAGSLYALMTATTNFLNAGMSAHMIGILSGLGLASATAVWIATLRGVGQSSARLGEVLFGRRIEPLTLNVLASFLLPVCFMAGLFSGVSGPAALAFALIYGAGNGVITIVRGTLPLVLFDHRSYGAFVGRLLAPSFLLSATAPLAYAAIIERFGPTAALDMSLVLAMATLAAAIILKRKFS